MAESRILGPDGRPFQTADLVNEEATGGLMSIRQVWHASVARGLTPAALAAILERSAEGDADDLLTLAEEVEERYPHLAAVLGVRKRAVSGLPVHVESASDDAEDKRIAEAVERLPRAPQFGELVDDLLDALFKPYSVCEIQWDRGREWWPRAYPHRDPRWFRYDRDTGRQLRLLDQEFPVDGKPLRPYTFITHQPRMKSGLQIRSGLIRVIAMYWLMLAYALKDWTALLEVFGMPLRLGRYGPNANAGDVRILKAAVASLGSDAAAVLPESMKIEFIEAANASGGKDLYQALCEYIDRQVSKAVLGQTMTTDAQSAGLGSNQASVHNDVRDDILRADVRDLETTINRDLVKPFVDLNFGPRKQYPRICFHVAEPEDLKLLTESLVKLVPLGLEVEESVIRDKFGLPEPARDGKTPPKLLRAPSVAMPAETALNLALNAAQTGPARDEIDRLVDDGLKDWHEQMDEIIDPIEQLAVNSANAEEFLAKLPGLAQSVDPQKLLRSLATAAFKARALGDGTDKV